MSLLICGLNLYIWTLDFFYECVGHLHIFIGEIYSNHLPQFLLGYLPSFYWNIWVLCIFFILSLHEIKFLYIHYFIPEVVALWCCFFCYGKAFILMKSYLSILAFITDNFRFITKKNSHLDLCRELWPYVLFICGFSSGFSISCHWTIPSF